MTSPRTTDSTTSHSPPSVWDAQTTRTRLSQPGPCGTQAVGGKEDNPEGIYTVVIRENEGKPSIPGHPVTVGVLRGVVYDGCVDAGESEESKVEAAH